MALSKKVRYGFKLMQALSAVGLAPTTAKSLKLPMEKRLAAGPGKRMIGPVVEVPTRDVDVTTRDGAVIQVRVYAPPGATSPVLYAHGGGFAIGGFNACDHICRRLAVESNAVIVSVQYRLAPEHRFPIPLQDCEDALAWLLEQGWDNPRLVVAGDSAGGNLAAALAIRLREQGTPLLGQLLIYPALDMTISGKGITSYRGIGVTLADCYTCAEVYLGPDGDPTDPYASPGLVLDASGLAPALVITVEHDPLREEGQLYAAKLEAAGVPTRLVDVLDHVHASLSLPALYDGIDELYGEMSRFIQNPAEVCTSEG